MRVEITREKCVDSNVRRKFLRMVRLRDLDKCAAVNTTKTLSGIGKDKGVLQKRVRR